MASGMGTSKPRLGDEYLSLHDKVIEELRQAILSGRLARIRLRSDVHVDRVRHHDEVVRRVSARRDA